MRMSQPLGGSLVSWLWKRWEQQLSTSHSCLILSTNLLRHMNRNTWVWNDGCLLNSQVSCLMKLKFSYQTASKSPWRDFLCFFQNSYLPVVCGAFKWICKEYSLCSHLCFLLYYYIFHSTLCVILMNGSVFPSATQFSFLGNIGFHSLVYLPAEKSSWIHKLWWLP